MESDFSPPPAPRKVKFAPKGPPKRKSTRLQPKTEVAGGGGDKDGEDETNEALIRKVNEHLTRRQPQAEKKSSVQVAFGHGVASPNSLRTYGRAKEDSGDRSNGIGLRDSAADTKEDILSLPSTTKTDWIIESSENATGSSFKQKKSEYREPWDYHHSYYPVTLPLRRPYSGNPEVLDLEEFGEDKAALEYDESAIHSASDLGLLEEGDEERMLFLQFPPNLSVGKRESEPNLKGAGGSRQGGSIFPAMAKGKEIPASYSMASGNAKGKGIVNSSMSSVGMDKKVCSLDALPAGYMGKMLVYKSGAVKLRIGDILYDVSPGSSCTFAQDIVAINTKEKHCCELGEITKRAIVSPDIDSLLDPVVHLT